MEKGALRCPFLLSKLTFAPALKNDLILRAARGQETERTPVWLMRQAGRILPEYRAVRKSAGDFKTLVKTPELAAEVTIQPVDILEVDAAIIFSDILVVPEALGLDYQMIEKQGPWFEKTIASKADLVQLRSGDVSEHLSYVTEAIQLTKKELNDRVPLIGFAGAPFTIFCYMTEGSGSKTFSKARKMLFREPELVHALMDRITDTTIAYLKAQIEAGADMLQVFDSWAGILSHEQYIKFGIPYLKRICDAVNEVPITLFSKGAYRSMAELAALDCNTLGVDWNMDIAQARVDVGSSRTLQGNLDPCALYANQNDIRKATARMLDSFGPQRHIANLGHGVYPDTEVDAVKCFIHAVKSHKYKEHEIHA